MEAGEREEAGREVCGVRTEYGLRGAGWAKEGPVARSTDCLSVREPDGGTGECGEVVPDGEERSVQAALVVVDEREGEPSERSRVDESGERDGGTVETFEDADIR